MPHAILDIGQYHFLAAATALMAEDWSQAGLTSELWPWPLKLYALEHREIVGQGNVIDLGIKPPKKPPAS